jgi:hypothetical protein
MADFRRVLTALAVLALMAGLASAQIGTIASGAGTAGSLACTANAAATPQVRTEGYTELVGDILITCQGGPALVPGSTIPTTNITVYVLNVGNITSRILSGSQSDILMLIDDPGSTLPTGANAGNFGFGPRAPQILCTNVQTGGCPAQVGTDSTGAFEVSVAPGLTTAAANVYQGVVGALGNNTVTFYGVPVLPPVTSGVTRTFRITNVRIPTLGLNQGQQISAYISTSPSTVLPISLATMNIATVANPGLITTVTTPTNSKTTSAATLNQCQSYPNNPPQTGPTTTLLLNFTEGFATSFKTRVVPMTNTQYAAEGTNTAGASGNSIQNIPGGLYNGFAANSESGFIYPTLTGGSNGKYTAGLADFGTRLKAVFTNVPLGITLYVSAVSSGTTSSTNLGNQSLTAAAIFIGTASSEVTSDGANFSATTGLSGASGAAANQLYPTSGVSGGWVQILPTAGTAVAIWEVTNANPGQIDTLTFAVGVGFTPAPGTVSATNPYGLPQVTTIPGQNNNSVQLSFAPEPGTGANFTAATGPIASTNIIPRFGIVYPNSNPFVSIALCQTTLLFPYVVSTVPVGLAVGFDTGFAIANTSSDPFTSLGFGTTAQKEAGSCTLYPYGTGFNLTTGAPTGTPPAVIQGCDVQQPGSTAVCWPVEASGTVAANNAANLFGQFQGYVIAVCNFQYAHGYAAITDVGLRNLYSSYLALELAPNCVPPASGGGASSCTGRGVSIEQLVH